MPASPAPTEVPAPSRSRSITSREVWAAIAWALGYEAIVWGFGVALRPVLLGLGANAVVATGLTWLWYALVLPASLIALLLTPSPDGWRSLLGLLGLDVAAATGVALFLIHRRAGGRGLI
jgi:hypothetical protein